MLMNRKETKLLVESWRNLIFESKDDSDLDEEEKNDLEKSRQIRLSLNSGIKMYGIGEVSFLDSPDLFVILNKNDLSSLKEFMSIKELANPAKLAKNEKKIELLKSAYESLMKIKNPTNVKFFATYGYDSEANIAYTSLDTILAGKFNRNYNCEFDARDKNTNDPIWKDGDDVRFNLENKINEIEEIVNGGRIIKTQVINPTRLLGRISILHLIINSVPEEEKNQIVGKNSKNWFLASQAIKPQAMKALIYSNKEIYNKSMTKSDLEPEDD